jgi:hypothetical protein
MFFASRFPKVRNVVLAGFNEIYHYHASDSVMRQYGMFLFNEPFLKATNAPFNAAKRKTLYGQAEHAFLPLTHLPENAVRERAAFNESIRNVLGTWQKFLSLSGARLIVMTQPTPALQKRSLSPEEVELLAHYDAASKIADEIKLAIADHTAWHRQEMEAMAREIGFDFFEINDRIGPAVSGKWLHIDRVHMTDLGYRAVAERLLARMQK